MNIGGTIELLRDFIKLKLNEKGVCTHIYYIHKYTQHNKVTPMDIRLWILENTHIGKHQIHTNYLLFMVNYNCKYVYE